ncbi:MAG: tRNA (guanosine(37)-N1)-methyltransferase TrmD [Lentisphaeria bacterium]|nr:tRNA (guanosine(37)-N1)-methyltransferase TrmD [Lentisphaeria bacterium]
MRVDIITLFPEIFQGALTESILGRAGCHGVVDIHLINLRDFADDKRGTVDDAPFGGGAGMVLKPEPLFKAVESVQTADSRVIFMTPQGAPFKQAAAETLARETHLIILCGHYEGIDERARQTLVDDEISIGDFILTNGAMPAMIVLDAVVRLLPGALGSEESAEADSFGDSGGLDFPSYTRPADFRGLRVPDVLLSGDHERVAAWRREQAILRTTARRPDLMLVRDDST